MATLDLEDVEIAGLPTDYGSRVDNENATARNMTKIQTYAGHVTSSFCTTFAPSGSVSDMLGDGAIIGASYTRINRVFNEVVAYAAKSGSGGVTEIDIQIQNTPAGAFSSIFSSSLQRPCVSSSIGDFGAVYRRTFVSSSWPVGCIMRAQLVSAAGAANASGQRGLNVHVFWKPSGSYGA